MADRYWVGGTANWDATAGTKWATTSGGTGGASVPTSADDVYFDAASTGTVTPVTLQAICRTLSTSGFTGTMTGSGTIIIHGGLTIGAGTTWSHTGAMDIRAASGSFTITTAGKTIGVTTFGFTGSSTATWTLGDDLTVGGSITVTAGTFDTGNKNVNATSLSSSNSNTRTINLGSSTVTLTSGTNTVSFTTNTNLTFNAGTSTISCSATAVSLNGGTTSSTGVTFNNVSFTSTGAGTHTITGTNTFANLTVAGPVAAGVVQVSFDSRQTITGTLSTTGTAGNRRVWFRSATYGLAQTLTINSAPSLTDADFRDIYVIGTSAPISGTRIGDLRGCRGITFSTPKTVYWNLAGAQNWSANGWSDTSTGTPNTNFFPLAQDTATFTNAGSVTGTITMDSAIGYTGTVDMSGRTSAMTLSIGAAQTIYGNWTNGSGTTLSTSNLLTFSGRNTQTINSAGKTFSGDITIDSYGGTVELAVNDINIGSNTLTVTNGTFDTKNFNVTASSLSSSNSNIRTITLGSSTMTLSGTSPINFGTATNLTFSAGTSSIVCTTAAASQLSGGGQTFYDVSFTGTGAAVTTISQSNIFTSLSITASASAGLRQISFDANQTITGTLTCAGATAVRRIFLRSDTLGTTRTLTVGTLSAQDCDFRDITIAGAAAGSSPTRAGDCGGNSGITFPSPKTVYWNLAGAQNWSATGWAPGSGGTPDINNFPLAQDTAVFDNTGSVTGTITINSDWNIGTFDASARTSAMTLSTSTNIPFVYGDWKFGTGVTSSNQSGTFTFGKRGTQTITSNGVQFGCPITIDCVTGTVQLADALSLGSNRQFTLTSGTFDAVSYNVTVGVFSGTGSSTRTLKMGSGTWTLSGTGTIWTISQTNLSFFKNTANIVLSDTSTSARTFTGNNLSYNKLTIGGTTGTSTLTITDNNQFTELASTKTVAHTIALSTTSQTFGKWTVTGTVGNVVTVTGTATLTIAGACTSGLDYLALGTTTVSATSPGEFYAGANSTATGAAAPLYLTAKPADGTRYWVGGTGNWSDTARWSTGSGGASGASVPRSHDDVIFNSASNATAYTATVNAVTGGIRMKSLTIAGPASGNVTLAGSTAMVGIHGNVTLPATGLTRTYTGAITLSSNSTGLTFTTNGVALASAITVNGVDCSWSLGSNLDDGTSSITVTNGTFNLATFNITAAGSISSDNGNSRTINFNTGTTTLSASTPINFGTTETNRANLTVTASTSQINCSSTTPNFVGGDQTFYDVTFTSTSLVFGSGISGTNTFRNLTITGRTSVGIALFSISANQTITGTLNISAGTDATMRTWVRSNVIGTTRTLTCAAVASLADIDFADITIAGAAVSGGNLTGTRLGDCKGNSGITFPAAKTVYWRGGTGNWSSSAGWSDSDSTAGSTTFFPLAQDTAKFISSPASGGTVTLNAIYNLPTIDMQARTTNTMTLATGTQTPSLYGDWINGTGTTLTGTEVLTFTGRNTQTITSAGKTFTQRFTINSPGGSVVLQDAFVTSNTNSSTLLLTAGTFDLNGYNATLSGGGFVNTGSSTRTLAIGAGTFTVGSSGTSWNTASTGFTITGDGTISLTSASAKTFAGGGIAYTNITLNQGGAGALTITGNNTFKDITNTYKATGATTISLGTTTQRVSQFTAAGESGRVLTVQGTSASSPGTLILTGATKPNVDYLTITGVRAYSLADTWYAGANSTNNGSLGWYFEAGPVVISASISETSTASDAVAAFLTFLSNISETATATDSVATIATLLAQVADAATGTDTVSAGLFFTSNIAETATATDTTVGGFAFAAVVLESATATDATQSAVVFIGAVSETATATDLISSLTQFLGQISENASITDVTLVAPSVFGPQVQEAVSALDSISATGTFNVQLVESATALDAIIGAYLWNLIDDSQNPNWQNIDT